ncbi:MAG TPA: uroporphyrinogen-III synthase [Dongiaceae bacterium]|nr:uroporphyrinogen-III synthase [Dongiaceae bacterium]
MHALITRPLEDAKPLADLLEARGVDCVVEPLLEIAPKPDARIDLDGVQALLFTSANGVRAFAAHSTRRDLKVLTVGEGSAEAARAAGFSDVTAAGGDVDALAALATSRLSPQNGALFHGAASALAGDLQGKLEAAGFTLRRAVLYEAKTATAFSPETRMNLALGGIDLVLLFSPRTARTFAELWRDAAQPSLHKTTALCLSPAVAREVAELGWQRIATAAHPDQDSMLALVETEIERRKATVEVLPSSAETPPLKDATPRRDRAESPPPPPPPPPISPRAPETAHAAPARARSGWIGGLIAGAAVAAIIAATAPAWQKTLGIGEQNTVTAADLAAVQAKVDALSSAGNAATPDAVKFAIEKVKADLAAENAKLEDRVGKLEQQLSALPPPAPEAGGASDLAPLQDRVAKLENDLAQVSRETKAIPTPPTVPDLSGDVAALRQQLQAATDEIKALEAQQATMSGTLQKVASMPAPVSAAEQRHTAIVLALGSLRGTLAADKPYAAGLKAIDLLAGDDAELKSKLAPALDPLRPLAETGAPTLAQLQASFPAEPIAEAANAETTAGAVGADQGWSERLINRLSQAVTVRPVGADVQGDGPLAKLARGEAKLKAGDLPGTIAEIGSLDGRAGQAAAPWLAQAKARLAEDQASVALDAASTELMAPPANSTAQ